MTTQVLTTLQILREAGQITALSYEEPVIASPVQNGINESLATPQVDRSNGTIDPELSISTLTPTFKTGSRLSSNSFPGSFVDPFISEDGSVAGRGRKRTKFGRYSGAWRLVDNDEDEQEQASVIPLSPRPLSPKGPTEIEIATPPAEDIIFVTENAATPQVSIESLSEDLLEGKVENDVSEAESPRQSLRETAKAEVLGHSIHINSLPSSPEHRIRIERPSFDSETMPTPRIQALTSPGLSIVSPLVARSQYFPTFETTMSELDASSQKYDQDVFADSSPVLGESMEADQLDSHGLSRSEPITIDQALEDTTSQAALFPTPTFRSGEIDLDALQEQIELNNATPTSVEAVDEAIEDADMYGPAIDTLPTEQSDIMYPSLDDLDRPSFESVPVLLDETYIPIENPPIEIEAIEATVNAPIIIPESVVKPLPSLLDNAVRELEFSAMDYEPMTSVNEIAPAKDTEPEFSFFPRRDRTDNQMPRFLDGSVDIDPIESEEVGNQAIEVPQQLELDAETVMIDQPPAPRIIEEVPVITTIENISVQKDPISSTNVLIEPSSPREQSQREVQPVELMRVMDEPALVTAQEAMSMEKSEQAERTPRRKSQRLLTKPGGFAGVYSEYFTPRKVSRARGSSPIQEQALIPQENVVETVIDVPESNLAEAIVTIDSTPKPLFGSMTTNLGFYVHLSQLAEYYNQVVDVIAICVSDSSARERAKSGPKDFHVSLQLVNASEAPTEDAQVTAQIFRPRKNVLPHTRRGDVLVLRSFLVQSMSHKPMLLSTDASAWAVFPSEDELRHDSKMPTIISGPPIELGSGEENLARKFFFWWKEEGSAQNPQLKRQASADRDTPSQPKSTRQTRKSRSELPPPLDLRRSPRKVRHDQSQNSAGQDGSPSFQPLSPTLSQRSLQSLMAPPSVPAAISPPVYSPTSQSGSSVLLKERTLTTLENGSNEPDSQHTPVPSSQPTFTRRHTRSISRASLDASQASPLDTAHVDSPIADRQTSTPFRQNISGSASENNSISGETSSSRRRRHERRSTSLIHELRDGTQWVDVEDSEVVSISASESDDDQMHTEETFDVPREPRTALDMEAEAGQADAEAVVEVEIDDGETIETAEIEALELPSTPVRRGGRGRPRRDDTQRSPTSTRSGRHARVLSQDSVSGIDESTNISPTAGDASARRVTRSRQKAAEKGETVHELRDGAKYTDQ